MAHASSIYDLTLNHLGSYDFSRPLFVQASRQSHFDEVVDLLAHRLNLAYEHVQLLTNAAYLPPPDRLPCPRLVNPSARLSSESAALTTALPKGPPSVIVLTTSARFSEPFAAVRDHSNLVAFGLASAPIPVLVINGTGHTAPLRTVFEITERPIGGVHLTANFQMSEDETAALYAAAIERADGHVVEIGRFSGASTLVLALAGRASGRPGVYSVDIAALELAEYLFTVHGLSDDVSRLPGDSVDVANRWRHRAERGIGLLFIDADHDYQAVARDLQHWAPFVVDGGTIVLHDMNLADGGVDRAVYYHLQADAAFRNLRQVATTLICERSASAA